MNEAISKAKRCELCPPDEETCYCYDDKPSVYLTESQLDEIVKEFVKPAVSEDDRRLKMTVLSLVSDLRNCRAELAEERAAHNAHVTELCELEKENRKMREELDAVAEGYRQQVKLAGELMDKLVFAQKREQRLIKKLREITKALGGVTFTDGRQWGAYNALCDILEENEKELSE